MKNIWKLFLAMCLFMTALSGVSKTLAETREQLFEKFNRTAERAEDALSRGEASNESLGILRSDIFELRNKALIIQKEVNEKYNTQKKELKLINDLISDSNIEGILLSENKLQILNSLESVTADLANAKLSVARAQRFIEAIDDLKQSRFNNRFFSYDQMVLTPSTYILGAKNLLDLFNGVMTDLGMNFNSEVKRKLLITTNAGRFALLCLIFGVLILIFRLKISTLIYGSFLDRPKNHPIEVFLPAIVNISIISLGALTILIFLRALGGNYGLPIFVHSLTPLLIVFLVGYLINSLVAVTQKSAETIATGIVPNLSGLKFSILFLSIVLAFYSSIDYMAERSLLSSEAEVTTNTVGLMFLVFGLFNFLKSVPGLIDTLFRLADKNAKGLQIPTVDLTSKILSYLVILLGIVGLAGYLLAAFEFSKILAYAFGVMLVSLYIDFGLRSLFFSNKNSKKEVASLGFLICSAFNILTLLLLMGLVFGIEFSVYRELWLRFNEGLSLGEVTVTPTAILNFAVLFVLGYLITILVQRVIQRTILPKTKLDQGSKKALISGIGYIGYTISAVIALSSTGFNLSSIAIVAGALSVGIGFGLQTIVSNFVSGVILLVERPIKEGDWIEASGFSGTVRKISVRSTHIETFDRAMVVVPNSELIAGSVLNWTHSNETGRVRVSVGVSYDCDPKKIEKLLLKIGKAHEMTLNNPEPFVRFQGFGDSSLDFDLIIYVKDKNYMFQVRSELHFKIFDLFKKEGIEIPFPQRDLNIKNPERLFLKNKK